jgi:SAM-dependent methyltransferase
VHSTPPIDSRLLSNVAGKKQAMPGATAYDQIRYPSVAFPQTHPDRLAAVGMLTGMDPAPPQRCRYLELGCGSGMNLLSMAPLLPDSTFLGIDLAAGPIEEASASVKALALGNLEFRCGDIAHLGGLGSFDYIVAHGVYSWVPEYVRKALLALCRAHLAPNGIAYISYNTYPGGHVRQMVRHMMRYHVHGLSDAGERLQQGRALIKFLVDAKSGPELYAQLLERELTHLTKADPGLVQHDDLAEINDPCYFHQFAAAAADHDLQYIAEAALHEMQDMVYSPQVTETLRRLDDDMLRKEQYLDFLKCRRFRQSLLCHQAVALDRSKAPAAIRRLHFACDATRTPVNGPASGSAPGAGVPLTFSRPNEASISSSSPLTDAALSALIASSPQALPFSAVLARVEAAVGGSAADDLAGLLLQSIGVGLVDLRSTPVPCVATVSARPVASRIARWQAARSASVTTLRHASVRLEGPLLRSLVTLMDGSRSIGELSAAIMALVDDQTIRIPTPTATRSEVIALVDAEVHTAIRRLLQLAILEG